MNNDLLEAALRVLNAWDRRETPDPADAHVLLNTTPLRETDESYRQPFKDAIGS